MYLYRYIAHRLDTYIIIIYSAECYSMNGNVNKYYTIGTFDTCLRLIGDEFIRLYLILFQTYAKFFLNEYLNFLYFLLFVYYKVVISACEFLSNTIKGT